MTQSDKPNHPRPPGRIRRYFAWVLVCMGVNPGYRPWEKPPEAPDDAGPPDKTPPTDKT
jgi:hypothetical protein